MKNLVNRKSNKKLKSSKLCSISSEDQISDLPDSIIQHVLSFLDTKDVVRTSVLSKRWVSLWTLVPSLMFCCKFSYQEEEHQRFICFVEQTLMNHRSPKLQKFFLKWPLTYIPKDRVDSWLQIAVNHEVEDLQLQNTSYTSSCYWPECLRINSSVIKLSLDSFYFDGRGIERFHWTSLRFLSLTNLKLEDGSIRCVLIGSPQIKCLTMRNCWFSYSRDSIIIDASFSSLEQLVIKDLRSTDQTIHISAPNHLSLTIMGLKYETVFKLVDASCLEKAYLEFSMDNQSLGRKKKMLKELVQDFFHVNNLTIAVIMSCHQDQSTKKPFRCRFPKKTKKAFLVRFPTESCKSFEIDMVSAEVYIPGLSALLCSLPNLELLTINLLPQYSREETMCEQCCGLKVPIRRAVIRHLKSVEITGFAAESGPSSGDFLVDLVHYILGNANALEKLIIYLKDETLTSATPETLRELLEITQELLSYPRASTKAAVLFESHLERF